MDEFVGLMFILFIGFCIYVAGGVMAQNEFKEEAVERGYAHYDQTTGDWGWNNEEEFKKKENEG